MKTAVVIIVIIIVGGLLLLFRGGAEIPVPPTLSNNQRTTTVENLKLVSPAFTHGEAIPSQYTCDGGDLNPPLAWSGVPEGAQSLVLIMDDPDAPGGTWDHWVIFNLSPTTNNLQEGATPSGIKGRNSWGRTGYGGPCPPDGEHRYFFKLYTLDIQLLLSEGATKQEVEDAMSGHVLARAELVGKYARN